MSEIDMMILLKRILENSIDSTFSYMQVKNIMDLQCPISIQDFSMGVRKVVDILQHIMIDLFQGFEFTRVNISTRKLELTNKFQRNQP